MKLKNNFELLPKKEKFRLIFKYGVLAVYVLCVVILCIESLMPGSVSSSHSNSVGDKLNMETNREIAPTSISLQAIGEELTKNVVVGQNITLLPVFTPQNATNKQVKWSLSNDKIAKINNDIITFTAAGDVTVTATSEYKSSIKASFLFTVSEVPVESIEIIGKKDTLEINDSAVLEAKILPENATNKEYEFVSSNPNCVSVNGSTITALSQGNATITAIAKADNSIVDSFDIEVIIIQAEELYFEINGFRTEETSLHQGHKLDLKIVMLPVNTTFKDIEWDLTNGDGIKITFNQATTSQITVEALMVGSWRIFAKLAYNEEIFASITINVEDILASDINYTVYVQNKSVESTPIVAYPGDKIRIDAIATPIKASNKKIAFSSSDAGLTVNSTGTVTAKQAGIYTVTLICDEIIKTIEFDIKEVTVEAIEIFYNGKKVTSNLEIAVSQHIALSAKLITCPSDRSPQSTAIDWISGNSEYLDVDATTGILIGLNVGTTILVCRHTASGKETKINIAVTPEEESPIKALRFFIDSVEYSEGDTVHLKTGKTYDFDFIGITDDGDTKTDISYSMSDSLSIKNGKLTTLFCDTATITIMGGKISITIDVDITDIEITSMWFGYDSDTVYYGQIFDLDIRLVGENGDNPTITDVIYDYDSHFLQQFDNSFVALNIGEVEITAIGGNITVTKILTIVSNVIGIDAHEMEVFLSEEAMAEFAPITANEADAALHKYTFTITEGSDIVSVSKEGIITPLKPGNAKLEISTLVEGKKISAFLIVKVSDKLMEQLTITTPTSSFIVGNEYIIGYSFMPKNATAKKIVWSISDKSKAAISSDGRLKILAAGTFTVTVRAEKGNAETSIDITSRNILSITLIKATGLNNFSGFDKTTNSATAQLTKNGSAQISIVYGANATYTTTQITSSNPELLEVNGSTITAKKAGTATITVTYWDESDIKPIVYTIEITVNNQRLSDFFSNWGYAVRKGIGHFGAFLFMGIFAVLTYLLFIKNKLLASIITFLSGFGIAGLTEFFQMLTPNRGPSFDDVLLDFQGFCFSVIPILIVFAIVVIIKKVKIKRRKTEDDKPEN